SASSRLRAAMTRAAPGPVGALRRIGVGRCGSGGREGATKVGFGAGGGAGWGACVGLGAADGFGAAAGFGGSAFSGVAGLAAGVLGPTAGLGGAFAEALDIGFWGTTGFLGGPAGLLFTNGADFRATGAFLAAAGFLVPDLFAFAAFGLAFVTGFAIHPPARGRQLRRRRRRWPPSSSPACNSCLGAGKRTTAERCG